MIRCCGFFILAMTLALIAGLPVLAQAATSLPPRPPQYEFVVDYAKVIRPDHVNQIRAIAGKLSIELATPIVVVTVPRIEAYAPAGTTLESFAQQLFNHWGVGQATRNGHPWNTGILVLWDQGTLHTRVELGRGWGHTYDAEVKRLLVEKLRPKREAGELSAGLVELVENLALMVRRDLPMHNKFPAVPRTFETGELPKVVGTPQFTQQGTTSHSPQSQRTHSPAKEGLNIQPDTFMFLFAGAIVLVLIVHVLQGYRSIHRNGNTTYDPNRSTHYFDHDTQSFSNNWFGASDSSTGGGWSSGDSSSSSDSGGSCGGGDSGGGGASD